MRNSRELKVLARQKMFNKYGTLAAGTAIYGAILVSIGIIILFVYSMNLMVNGVFNSIETMQAYVDKSATSYTYTLITEFAFIFIGAITSTVAGGVQYMCLQVAREKDVSIKDVLFVIRNNPDKIIIIYFIQQLLMFLFNLPADIIAVFANNNLGSVKFEVLYFIFMTLGYIADICIIVMFSQAVFIYLDNPTERVLSCIEQSTAMMGKNFSSYFKLILSFIPQYLLVIVTFGIGYLWVLPYQYTTMGLYYMGLKGEIGSRIDVTIQ